MPNLRIFDIKDSYTHVMQQFLYLCLIGEFHAKFWTEKQWFFKNQCDCRESSDGGIFFSTDPYR
jgi:hypothetical protein